MCARPGDDAVAARGSRASRRAWPTSSRRPEPFADPRGAVAGRRRLAHSASTPIVGPELEFFLLERDPDAPGGFRRHVDHLCMVYTVGPQADPDGVVRRLTEDLAELGLEPSR